MMVSISKRGEQKESSLGGYEKREKGEEISQNTSKESRTCV